ncbi:MAG: TraX family protein [Eubacteriales bacterium]|nr:TraX family protein [Eubacteriales bacterium]
MNKPSNEFPKYILPKSIFPERFLCLSGSALKLIAIITMLIDHIGAILLVRYAPANEALFHLFGKDYSLYRVSRDIGRIAFPIFCFLLVEGFIHTRNRFRYGWNLFLFALISEIPWNMWHNNGHLLYPLKQNVFFTLFFGYVAFCLLEYFWENQWIQILSVIALLIIAYYFHADYGWKGFIFLLIMYWFRMERPAQAVIGSCWLHYEWKALFAFIPINLYNGERGFIKGTFGKYFFYAFYPVHILILLIIKHYVGF